MLKKLKLWLHADEIATDGRGWSVNLDVFRIIFLGAAVLPWALWNLAWIETILPGLSRDVWVPVSFYRLIPLDVLTRAIVAHTLAVINLVFIVLGLIGFCTRTTIGCATLLSIYLFGLAENQGKIDHFHHLIWFMALLAVGPSGRFLSIDAVRRAIRNADRGLVESPLLPFDALWTLRYVWLLTGLLFLIPGLAKLEKAVTSGWASASNLQHVIWRKWLELALYSPGSALPIRVDLFPAWLLEAAGVGVIVFEIGFVFLVLFRRLRPAAALAGLAFHVTNGLILQIWFTVLVPAYLCLIDWYALGSKLWRGRQGPLIVLYDGQCRFCRRTIAVLKSLDLFDTLAPKAVMNFSGASGLELHHGITYEKLTRDLYVSSGSQAAAGYDAYVWIVKRLPLFWPVAIVMQWSPVATLGRRVYRDIADSRYCSLNVPARQQRTRTPAFWLIHLIGVGLLACQLSVSGTMFLYDELGGFTARLPAPANRLVVGVGRRKPVWPFDHYPTFASPTSGEVEIWEAWWVVLGGHEVRVSARTYDTAFGNSGLIWNLVSDARDEDQARSLDLARALWRGESPDVRQSVIAVRIYRARYRLQLPEHALAKPLSATLLHTFPVELVSQYRIGTPG
jgi:predicted DCC family thiol-disulfide oxidoreductase YuxK